MGQAVRYSHLQGALRKAVYTRAIQSGRKGICSKKHKVARKSDLGCSLSIVIALVGFAATLSHKLNVSLHMLEPANRRKQKIWPVLVNGVQHHGYLARTLNKEYCIKARSL
jgi:hypothetical protein